MSEAIRIELAEALMKAAAVKGTPRAARLTTTEWAAEVVRALKRKASSMQKGAARIPGTKSGSLARNTGFEVKGQTAAAVTTTIGTGLKGSETVIYATIQDEGGTTHPTVTPRMRSWAWAMHKKMFAREVRGLQLKGRERKGAFATWSADSIFKALALTKKTKLTVRIPASLWFTGTLNVLEPGLEARLRPEALLAKARAMVAGGGGGAQ